MYFITRWAKALPQVRIAPSVLATLEATIGAVPAESGASLFADKDGVIRSVEFDAGSASTRVTYHPDLPTVRRTDLWMTGHQELVFAGFAHSHPTGSTRPSAPDLEYAGRLMDFKRLDALHLPIVQSAACGGQFGLHWWVARRPPTGGQVRLERAAVVPVADADDRWLERIASQVDLATLRDSRVVAAGVGGARSALEDLARAGVGQFVLIDPDDYELSNLATQHARRAELGIGKATATAAAIRDINPDAVVVAIRSTAEEALGDPARRRLLLRGSLGGRRTRRTLLGAWTDSHQANAFIAHLGLEEHLPVVFADLFRYAAAGAVAFVHPGLTAACHRCWVESRYRHYEDGGTNPVTSDGAEIWATSRLNALKVRLTLLLLQSSFTTLEPSPPAPVDDLVSRLAQRPVAVVRLRPDVSESTGLGVFDRFDAGLSESQSDSLAIDTTLWVPVRPRQGCVECGGTGTLRPMKEMS